MSPKRINSKELQAAGVMRTRLLRPGVVGLRIRKAAVGVIVLVAVVRSNGMAVAVMGKVEEVNSNGTEEVATTLVVGGIPMVVVRCMEVAVGVRCMEEVVEVSLVAEVVSTLVVVVANWVVEVVRSKREVVVNLVVEEVSLAAVEGNSAVEVAETNRPAEEESCVGLEEVAEMNRPVVVVVNLVEEVVT